MESFIASTCESEKDATTVTLTLDAHDRIESVGGRWNDFALANGGESIVGERILGTPIMSFIRGEASQMYVRVILESIRMRPDRVSRAYRCDSPDTKRFMSMEVETLEGRRVQFTHRLLSAVPQPAMHERIYLTHRRCTVCSMCLRARHNGVWQEGYHVAGAMTSQPPLIYGICPDCGHR